MSKTPEQMAKEWYWANLTEESPVVMLSNPVKHPPCPRKAFVAGYEAGRKHLFQFEAKMWIDLIGPQNRWISVAEKLPEDRDVVAVWTNEGDIHAAWRKNGAWRMFNPCCTYESEVKNVSHWHEIADTPEEKEI